jgi:hypothetical protein
VLEEQPLPDAEEMGRNHWGYPAWYTFTACELENHHLKNWQRQFKELNDCHFQVRDYL